MNIKICIEYKSNYKFHNEEKNFFPLNILGSPSKRGEKLSMNIEICIELKSNYKSHDIDNLFLLIHRMCFFFFFLIYGNNRMCVCPSIWGIFTRILRQLH